MTTIPKAQMSHPLDGGSFPKSISRDIQRQFPEPCKTDDMGSSPSSSAMIARPSRTRGGCLDHPREYCTNTFKRDEVSNISDRIRVTYPSKITMND